MDSNLGTRLIKSRYLFKDSKFKSRYSSEHREFESRSCLNTENQNKVLVSTQGVKSSSTDRKLMLV